MHLRVDVMNAESKEDATERWLCALCGGLLRKELLTALRGFLHRFWNLTVDLSLFLFLLTVLF